MSENHKIIKRLDLLVWFRDDEDQFNQEEFTEDVANYFFDRGFKLLTTGHCCGEVPEEDVGHSPYDLLQETKTRGEK